MYVQHRLLVKCFMVTKCLISRDRQFILLLVKIIPSVLTYTDRQTDSAACRQLQLYIKLLTFTGTSKVNTLRNVSVKHIFWEKRGEKNVHFCEASKFKPKLLSYVQDSPRLLSYTFSSSSIGP